MKKTSLILSVFFFSLTSAQIAGKVVKVVDGDTFHLLTQEQQLYKIKVADVDAPKRGQFFSKRPKILFSLKSSVRKWR